LTCYDKRPGVPEAAIMANIPPYTQNHLLSSWEPEGKGSDMLVKPEKTDHRILKSINWKAQAGSS
jgi:hypothetical protein